MSLRWGTVVRRGAGFLLMAAVIAPWWHLANPAGADLLADTIRRSDQLLLRTWLRTAVLLAVAAAIAAALGQRLDTIVSRVGTALRRPSTRAYALAMGVLGAGYAAAISVVVWEGRAPLTDGWAQLIQARYLGAGRLAAPPDIPNAFYIVANTFVTDAGWTAQYPPGHPALLAVGLAVGMPWLIGPVLAGGTAALVVLLGERLIPDDPVVARLGGLFAAVGPLLAFPAAAYLSHSSAAFLTVLAAYAAARAVGGGAGWAALAGLSVGSTFLTRPLTGVTIGLVAVAGAWLAALQVGGKRRRNVGRLALATGGALVTVVIGLWYNTTVFGSSFQFGYTAYLGPAHAPGWHADPWGHAYGVREAIAFTTADLTALGSFLLRTPLSAVFVIGLFLAVAERLRAFAILVASWCAMAVVNAAAYWHHDLLLGPRMLADAAPAWCLALAMSGIGVVRWLPADRRLAGPVTGRRLGTAVLTLAAAYGIVIGAPQAVLELDRVFPPPPAAPRSPGPTLVFVHDSWSGRVAARLGAIGMRADSIAALLRTIDTCAVQGFLDGHVAETELRRGEQPGEGLAFTDSLRATCAREERADRFGGLPLMPLIWQGDLPGLGGRDAMFVRDLGPHANAQLLSSYPERRPGMLLQRPPGPRPAIVPYDTGVMLLWGPDPEEASAPDSTTSGR